MKTYSYSISSKMCNILLLIFVLIFGPLLIIDNLAINPIKSLFAFSVIIFSINGVYSLFHTKITVDNEKIEKTVINIYALFNKEGPIKKVLYWNEIQRIDSFYIFFDFGAHIALQPHSHINKKPIKFAIMPMELIQDILDHLPNGVKINLYPELQKRLDYLKREKGKQHNAQHNGVRH